MSKKRSCESQGYGGQFEPRSGPTMLKHVPSLFQHLPADKAAALTLDTAEPVSREFMLKLLQFYKTNQCKDLLPIKTVKKIIKDSEKLLHNMPALLEIDIADDEEIVIVGDIHGQLFDLMNIIDLIGEPAKRCKYIFNGDFVDRGAWGIECLMILLGKCRGRGKLVKKGKSLLFSQGDLVRQAI